jgi:hypothetical protein
MRSDKEKRYTEELAEFHCDKGWFYVTPEESRKAFETLQAQIATEKKQREAVDGLFQGTRPAMLGINK